MGFVLSSLLISSDATCKLNVLRTSFQLWYTRSVNSKISFLSCVLFLPFDPPRSCTYSNIISLLIVLMTFGCTLFTLHTFEIYEIKIIIQAVLISLFNRKLLCSLSLKSSF